MPKKNSCHSSVVAPPSRSRPPQISTDLCGDRGAQIRAHRDQEKQRRGRGVSASLSERERKRMGRLPLFVDASGSTKKGLAAVARSLARRRDGRSSGEGDGLLRACHVTRAREERDAVSESRVEQKRPRLFFVDVLFECERPTRTVSEKKNLPSSVAQRKIRASFCCCC